MWVELICGLVIYRLVRRFFYDDSDDPLSDFSPSHSTALFSVADRLEKLYRGGKAYVGLRIPDADSGSRQNIDLVLLTKGEAVVISVKNLSGFVSLDPDGTWVCTGSHKTHRIPDPVAEAKTQVAILEAYLEQRGVALPEGFLSCKVVCPNPNFRTITPSYFPSEVVTHEQWIQLKPEQKSILSGWIKGAFRSTKKEMQESIQQNLGFILSTAPMWDRLELKGNKYLLGANISFRRIKRQAEENGDITDSEKDYDMLPKVVEFSEQNGGGREEKPKTELPTQHFEHPSKEIPQVETIVLQEEPVQKDFEVGHLNGVKKEDEKLGKDHDESVEGEFKMWESCKIEDKDVHLLFSIHNS